VEGDEYVSGVNLMTVEVDRLFAVRIASSEPLNTSTAPWASAQEFPMYFNEQGNTCSPSQSVYVAFVLQKLSIERLRWRFCEGGRTVVRGRSFGTVTACNQTPSIAERAYANTRRGTRVRIAVYRRSA
jgi:hypothetical protein